jgi:hypothetical protein
MLSPFRLRLSMFYLIRTGFELGEEDHAPRASHIDSFRRQGYCLAIFPYDQSCGVLATTPRHSHAQHLAFA